jgi:hypothetical protein
LRDRSDMAEKPKPKASPKPKDKPDKEQSARFIETARELEVDESGGAFERSLDRVLPRPRNPGV